MKQKIILTFLMLLAVSIASAYDIEIDGIYYNFNDDGTSVTVTYATYINEYGDEGRIQYYGDLIIPESIEFYGMTFTVTGIGDYAFYECFE